MKWKNWFGWATCFAVVLLLGALVLPTKAEAKVSGYYTYSVSSSKATITQVSTDIYGDVVIPSTLGGYTVKAIGEGAFSYCEDIESVTIPSSVTTIGKGAFYACSSLEFAYISEGVTTINDQAFGDCQSLIGVELPASLKTIGQYVFAYCFSLEELNVAAGSKYFCTDSSGVLYSKDMTRLVKVPVNLSGDYQISDKTTTVDSYAFDCYEDLKSVYIPAGVKTIGELAFYDCMGILEYIVDSGNPNYSCDDYGVLYNKKQTTLLRAPQVFYGAYIVPKGVTTVKNGAFYKCTALEAVVLPEGVTTIESSAFEACVSLCHIGLPSTLKTIGEYAFADCQDLPRVAIPSGVTSLPEAVFGWCDNLRYLELPSSVTTINQYAFYNCYSLYNIYYSGTQSQKNKINTLDDPQDILVSAEWHINACKSTAHNYGDGFRDTCAVCGFPRIGAKGLLYTATYSEVIIDGFAEPLGGELVIPAYIGGLPVTTIRAEAFSGKGGITAVVLGNNITTIEEDAFYGCSGLQKVALGDSVTTVGAFAFSYCPNLQEVELSKSVSTIEPGAFAGCYQLSGVTVDPASPYFCTDSKGVLYSKDMTRLVAAPYGLSGTYTLPTTVKVIESLAFWECDQLQKVVLPEGLTTIRNLAFSFSDIRNLQIPASVTEIENGAFMATFGLGSVQVDPNNQSYCTDAAGVLYNKAQTELIFACTTLSGHYQIPASVTTIADGAMFSCDKLESLEIPVSVTKIGEEAFYVNESLTDVWYGGSQAQKDAIVFGEYNDSLLEATWHLNFCGEGNHSFSSLCQDECDVCDYVRTAPHSYGDDRFCDLCGHENGIPGDMNADLLKDTEDAVYLLLHVLFGADQYPVASGAKTDINGDGKTDTEDAVYLLLNVLFGDAQYPI